MKLHVLYEDDALIAVDKPAGIVVHPTYKNAAGTLLDLLRSYASDWPDGQNPTIVGRLDKDTSGIVVAAKAAPSHAALQRIWSGRDSVKDYLAVVRGPVNVASGTIRDRLRIDPGDRRRVVVSPDNVNGLASETQFERLEAVGGFSVLRCRLVTGRRHQIRVHLAARGWPIVGDRVYGEAVADFRRHALHAWRASFDHPLSGERIRIEAPVPLDILALIS